MKVHRASVLLAMVATFVLGGCQQNDYGTAGCSSGGTPPVPDFWAGPGVIDVTFLAFGDSQVYLDSSQEENDGGRKNDLHVQALNAAETLRWNALGVDEPVSRIRGVLMTGDITQNGRDVREAPANEYKVFVDDYGLCGNRTLRYPMYEGYGNHDFRSWANLLYGNEHPVADSVGVRNPYRMGLTNQAPGKNGHYSWNWDGIHFMNVNLAPSDVVPTVQDAPAGCRDPRQALTYLVDDLAGIGPDQPVVITHHYPPNSPDFEWDDAQIEAYYSAVRGYNVIAILHGHWHHTSTETWRGIPTFNLGSPYYLSYSPDGRGHFTVFRLTNDRIYAYDASWDPSNPVSLQGPDEWSRIVELPLP